MFPCHRVRRLLPRSVIYFPNSFISLRCYMHISCIIVVHFLNYFLHNNITSYLIRTLIVVKFGYPVKSHMVGMKSVENPARINQIIRSNGLHGHNVNTSLNGHRVS